MLAHEIGHVRGRHLQYVFVLQLGLLVLLNGAMIVLQNWVELIEPLVLGAVVYAIVLTTLGGVLLPVSIAAAMRVAECKAERYAASVGCGEALASALERRSGADPAMERAPRILRAYWLHPSPSSRIEALRTAGSESTQGRPPPNESVADREWGGGRKQKPHKTPRIRP